MGFSLTYDQIEAVKRAATNKITLITGRKGVGKTTAALALARLFADEGLRVVAVTPTRRNSDDALGVSLNRKTISDLLEYNEYRGKYEVVSKGRLEADLLILDEATEVDMAPLDALLGDLSLTTSALLVGDLGCARGQDGGGIWQDLATSGGLNAIELKTIPRGEGLSLLALNAGRLDQGQYLYFQSRAYKKDFVFLKRMGEAEIERTVKDLAVSRLPEDYGHDPTSDIQVITPLVSGPLGEGILNRSLQEWLNPTGERISGTDLRVGDRVIQEVDNPVRRVLAGEVGRVETIDHSNARLRVSFGGYLVDYDSDEVDELSLSYALHPDRLRRGRSRAVIVILDHEGGRNGSQRLDRNTLYRALAAADEMAILVGGKKALSDTINRVKTPNVGSLLLHKFEEWNSPSSGSSNIRDAYLDVEADRSGHIVMIGIHVPDQGTVQLVGKDLTREALVNSLAEVKTIYTYNGDRFDLPVIRKELGVNLKDRYATHDLAYDCLKRNLYGGLKKVEEALGIGRKTEGLKGEDAIKLWGRYQSLDDKESYKLLLLYNKEDVENLYLLKEKLGVRSRKK